MKIRLKATGDVRDCSPDVGEMAIALGGAVALTPQEVNDYVVRKGEPLPYHDVNWSAREGDIVDAERHQYAPALVWRCQTCQQFTFIHPEDKPASDNVFHFQKQTCPAEVYAAYVRLFEAWNKLGNRRLKGKYDRLLDSERQRTKDGLDDPRSGPPRNGAVGMI